ALGDGPRLVAERPGLIAAPGLAERACEVGEGDRPFVVEPERRERLDRVEQELRRLGVLAGLLRDDPLRVDEQRAAPRVSAAFDRTLDALGERRVLDAPACR